MTAVHSIRRAKSNGVLSDTVVRRNVHMNSVLDVIWNAFSSVAIRIMNNDVFAVALVKVFPLLPV